MNWYKTALNSSDPAFQRANNLKKQIEELKSETRHLSQQYLDLDEKDKEAANKFYSEVVQPPRSALRELETDWEQEIKRLLSLGLITIEEAKAQGYYQSGHETEQYGVKSGWQPLPPVLYHVTTAKSKVIENGLKTRRELKQNQGVGLGGGADDTISFTSDINTTYAILNGLLEMKKVVEGKFTVQDMLEMAKKGIGAKRPYIKELVKGATDVLGDLEDLSNGYVQYSSLARPPDNKHEWIPVEDSGWQGKDKKYYGKWKRKRDEEEQLFALYQFYGRFSSYREQAGGMEDPLFFSADVKALANIPESEIAILEFRAKPGAMGYPLSGLIEWRVGTGEAVEFVKEIKPPQGIVNSLTLINWYRTSQASYLGDCRSITMWDATEMSQLIENSEIINSGIAESYIKDMPESYNNGGDFIFGRNEDIIWAYDDIKDIHYFYEIYDTPKRTSKDQNKMVRIASRLKRKSSRWGLAGSGVLYYCPYDKTVLLLKRSDQVEDPGIWGIAGGAVKGTEDFYDDDIEAPDFSEEDLRSSAYTEVDEEMGHVPEYEKEEGSHTTVNNNFKYTTFLAIVNKQQKNDINEKINLNWESNDYQWYNINRLPKDIHPGVISAIQNLISSKQQLQDLQYA